MRGPGHPESNLGDPGPVRSLSARKRRPRGWRCCQEAAARLTGPFEGMQLPTRDPGPAAAAAVGYQWKYQGYSLLVCHAQILSPLPCSLSFFSNITPSSSSHSSRTTAIRVSLCYANVNSSPIAWSFFSSIVASSFLQYRPYVPLPSTAPVCLRCLGRGTQLLKTCTTGIASPK